jgi:hypothetical protein
MQHLELRLLWWQRLLGPAVVLSGCLLLLASPIAFPWRISAVTALLATGLALWHRHLCSRPQRLLSTSDGRLSCVCGDGREADVDKVRVGIAHPRLLSARLTLADGRRCDLWVPAASLHPDRHRALRAALLRFRA